MQFETEAIVGYPVCRDPVSRMTEQIIDRIQNAGRPCCYFSCLNPHAVEMAAADPAFRAALLDADFLTPDGIGVVYVSRLIGSGRIRRRTTGMDVFLSLSRAMNDTGNMSCFFLGSTDETLKKVQDKMARDFPRVRVAGTYSPPFKPEFDPDDTDEMIERINGSKADVLWVGLTAPKQEKWVYRCRNRLDVAFAGPIGAAFDFYAGNIKRAGPVLQGLGLEWLPRLVQEPRRLWRRSFVSAPSFFIRSLRYRLSPPPSNNR
jgi:N-acetylglucosaminyldiphosphoundecaprenol N-acetyl-beta-D-mannosaminyltransferase